MLNEKLKNKILNISNELKYTNPHRCKHFSFIVKRSTILSFGQNTYDKTHPIGKKLGYRNGNIHSELAAVVNFEWDRRILGDCDIVNVRLNRHGTIRYSKPCNCCLKLLEQLDVNRVYYTNKNGGFDKIKL